MGLNDVLSIIENQGLSLLVILAQAWAIKILYDRNVDQSSEMVETEKRHSQALSNLIERGMTNDNRTKEALDSILEGFNTQILIAEALRKLFDELTEKSSKNVADGGD